MGTEYMANKFSKHLTLTIKAKNDLKMVVCSRQEGPNAISPTMSDTDHDNRVGFLQHRMGSLTRRAPDRWKVVPRGNFPPHKLS